MFRLTVAAVFHPCFSTHPELRVLCTPALRDCYFAGGPPLLRCSAGLPGENRARCRTPPAFLQRNGCVAVSVPAVLLRTSFLRRA